METADEESAFHRKLIMLVSIMLALLLAAICCVGFIFIRNKWTGQPTQQLAQMEIPLATAVIPTVQVFPTLVIMATPTAIPVPISPLWRFISINKNDIGTFENTSDPSQKLLAKCIDPERPPPDKGVLYMLYDSGILKPQEGGKKVQRFELISGE